MHEPSQDHKFAKSLRALQKEVGVAQFVCMGPTSHASSGLKFWEMLVPRLNLLMMHLKKQIQAENKVCKGSHCPACHF